jgi:hypothetical protein
VSCAAAVLVLAVVLVGAGCSQSRMHNDDALPAPASPSGPASADNGPGEDTVATDPSGEEQVILRELPGLGGQYDESAAGEFVIAGPADWEGMWRRQGRAAPPWPEGLNQQWENALVVFLGSRTTGGYQVKIERVVGTPEGTVAVVRETVPGSSCMVTTAITYPRHGVVVERVAQPVRFLRLKTVSECE